MYSWRGTAGPVDLAFTDRSGGVSAVPYDELNLAASSADDADATAENWRLLLADFAPNVRLADMHQVHGHDVGIVAEPVEGRPSCDALVSAQPDVVLAVRVADCVPVLIADVDAGVVAAVHAGRPGLAAGIVPAAVASMRALGARALTAWMGPYVCGACYEVPAAMQAAVGLVVPEAIATTSWGTPALDIGAGVRAQLAVAEVATVDVSTCTRQSPALYSYRRDGDSAGRFAGLIRLRG